MSFLEVIASIHKDGRDGSVSSKRVVTTISFLLCAVAFVANLFWGIKVAEYMYNSMMSITLGGLAATASEKFSPK